MALRTHPSGFQFCLGTILDPEKTLNWNGKRGTDGVRNYLNSYFATPACDSPRPPQHPPLSITIRNPNTQDIIHASILNNHLFSTAKSLRITVEPRLCQSPDVYPVLDVIPSILVRMREVETVTLDEGALVAVLPMLQGHMPALRNLRYMAIESRTSEVGSYHDMSGVATRSIVRQYVQWRARVGRPVHALGCGPMRGEGRGNLTSGKWKRQGVVAIPL
ncbi:hypothetical protein FA13DRAFT_1524771 [Coprinellus micaceus]|uniref:Uncharacterized protein n=1 Tax=Coprinellus micaceus TaxID=71717 RepID=A0A4Y7SJ63_COPMI|nr:hypothetical protein FA13DRAFT_1524771 [Coprinellus micaceus]